MFFIPTSCFFFLNKDPETKRLDDFLSSFACSNLLSDRSIYSLQKYSITFTCYLIEYSQQQRNKQNEAER